MEFNFLELGLLLLFITLAGLIASKVKFSIVPIIIIIGLILPPNGLTSYYPEETTFEAIHFMGRLGILFLLFALGLEFSIKKLLDSAKTIVTSGVVYLAINDTLTVLFAVLLGWHIEEILVATGIILVASSAIVAKTLVDLKRTANPETETILGLMLFQDICMAVYLPIVTAIVITSNKTPSDLLLSEAIVFLVIALFIIISLKTTWILEKILDMANEEALMISIVACLIFIAGVSSEMNFSEAIGALIFGLILAETSHHERIMRLIAPFRDFFGAVFFFGFAFEITLDSLTGATLIALGAVAITLVGNTAYGLVMGRIIPLSKRGALNLGLAITPRGEFSIVLASLGIAAGLDNALKSFVVLYVVILAILGPLLNRWSGNIYRLVAPIFGWKIEAKKAKRRHSPNVP